MAIPKHRKKVIFMSSVAFAETLEKAYTLPDKYKDTLAIIINQFCGLASSDTAVNSKKIIGIADGKYHIPEDINAYDDDIVKLFGL